MSIRFHTRRAAAQVIAQQGGRAQKRRLLPLLVALLALCWQAFAVQTHVHPVRIDGGPRSAVIEDGGATAELGGEDCLLCAELAHAGDLLTPAAPAYHIPFAVAAAQPRLANAHIAPRDRQRGWRNRGPPSSPEPRR